MGDKRTGGVFHNILDWYVSENGSENEIGNFENVVGLAHRLAGQYNSNLDWVHWHFKNKAKQFMVPFLLDPRDKNWPVSRPRVWMNTFRQSLIQGFSEIHVTEIAKEIMNLATGAGFAVPIQSLLFENDDPVIKNYFRFLLASKDKVKGFDQVRTEDNFHEYVQNLKDKTNANKTTAEGSQKRKSGARAHHDAMAMPRHNETGAPTCMLGSDDVQPKSKRGQKWVAQHLKAAGGKWLSQTGPSLAMMKANPGLLALTDRDIDCLCVKGVRFPEIEFRALDLMPSFKRSTITAGCVNTVTPMIKLYFTNLMR